MTYKLENRLLPAREPNQVNNSSSLREDFALGEWLVMATDTGSVPLDHESSRDRNHNGEVDYYELQKLDKLGVQTLFLDYVSSDRVDKNLVTNSDTQQGCCISEKT